MEFLKSFREAVVILTMVAVLTGGKIDTNNLQSVFTLQNINAVEDWQENSVVNTAEKDLKCSAVKINLYKKAKYKLNGSTVKIETVLGLIKNEEWKNWWQKNENCSELILSSKINIYDCKNNVVAVINTEKIKELELYNAGYLRAKIKVTYSKEKNEASYSEYKYDNEGRLIYEQETSKGERRETYKSGTISGHVDTTNKANK